jgi:LytS/YehU family sensor histidine kinase
MNLSTRWWYAFAIWPTLALAASLADWSWHRQSFVDEVTYHLFGDLVLILAVAAVPFLLQRQRRRPEHLQALEAELHPHFLFNTLNSIATLMHEDVDAADEMMAKLATLLRRTMDRQGAVEIPLREELEMLEIYLDIQRTRYADRLTTEVSADPAALDVLVPRLLLQPVVENAVRHGISRRTGPGRIAVQAACGPAGLHLTVTNDGAGWPAPQSGGSGGLGLKNTRERLKRFDRRCVFELREGGDQGAVASLSLPVRR